MSGALPSSRRHRSADQHHGLGSERPLAGREASSNEGTHLHGRRELRRDGTPAKAHSGIPAPPVDALNGEGFHALEGACQPLNDRRLLR